jgi:transposase
MTMTATTPLFGPDDLDPTPTPASAPTPPPHGEPRLRTPIRDQVELRWASLDELLDPDHPARIVWAAVSALDLHAWRADIRAVEGRQGRDATDPRLLLALWVYATIQGVGSARQLARLTRESLPYQWLCGGVTVNYHLLADFRSNGGDKWDDLLTHLVASLLEADLVTLERVAQDGMKVRADAGTSSFRRHATLEEALQEARQQVEATRRLAEQDHGPATPRQIAARRRAARERQERIAAAMRTCAELQRQRAAGAKKHGRPVTEARASTTDPEARTMKFADGGFRPGYNVQFATDVASGAIVGVEVTNAGTDSEELPPMLDQLEQRYQRVPKEALVDGGFVAVAAIEAAAERGCTVYAPVRDEAKQRAAGKDPFARKPGDSAAVGSWRERMGTEAAQGVYRLRCQTAEWVNAQCRNRGLWQMPVRGLGRCRQVALLYAIAHNLVVAARLRAAAVAGAAVAVAE